MQTLRIHLHRMVAKIPMVGGDESDQNTLCTCVKFSKSEFEIFK